MKILAVVPARSGSKRLPGKNKLLLSGIPLIKWTLESARQVPEITDILISTDDPEIIQMCQGVDVLTPWLRPPELATNEAETIDVLLHAIDWYESEIGKLGGVMLLQPTSPFRKSETIRRAIEIFKNNGNSAVVSFSPLHGSVTWVYTQGDNGLLPVSYVNQKALDHTSVELIINGVIYIATPEQLRRDRSFITTSTSALVMDQSRETIDIDTPWDFELAQSLDRSNNST